MIINHNLMANNAIRNMNINSGNASKAMQKLSSGLRINSAADDAAGLAISEKMRGQIRGLDQASANAQDGISMLQTAEGNLNETTSILQRMKELATQSANDTNVGDDRSAIQTEINQLSSEINRIGNTAEFNRQSLLNGGGTDVAVKTTTAGVTVGSGPRQTAVGVVSTPTNVTGAAGTLDNPGTQGSTTFTISTKLDAGQTIVVGGHTITAYADSTAKGSDAYGIDISSADDADKQAAAIRAMSFGTGLTVSGTGADVTLKQNVNGTGDTSAAVLGGSGSGALSQGTTTAGVAASVGTAVKGSTSFTITTALAAGETMTVAGHTITAYASAAEKSAANNGAGDSYGMVVSSGNDDTAAKQAAAIATMFASDTDINVTNASGAQLKFEQKVGGTGDVTAPVIAGAASAGTAGVYNFDVTAHKAGDKMTIDGQVLTFVTGGTAAACATELKTLIGNNSTLNAKYTTGGTGANITFTQKSGKESPVAPLVKEGDTSQGFSATLQIGANTDQSLTINISDMRAKALFVTGDTAGATRTASNGKVASYVSVLDVTDGTSSTTIEYALDISSHTKATNAISVIQDAITAVSTQRANLGAYQNRLEHTINNLGTASENLTTSESRIRDVDMAKEMSTFSKNNILSQAAQAMLAQANQQPQQVLQLLR